MLAPWKKNYEQSRQHIKKQRHYFSNKGLSCQSYGFSSSHVWMWELDHKQCWTLKNCCLWTLVLEKTPESPLDCKEIHPVHPKGDHCKDWCWSWNSNTLTTWCEELTHWKKTLMLGKIVGRRRRGWQRMRWLDWHHWLDGHEFEQAPGVGNLQGSLECCNPWGFKELDMTEQLNWTTTIREDIYCASGELLFYPYAELSP